MTATLAAPSPTVAIPNSPPEPAPPERRKIRMVIATRARIIVQWRFTFIS
jgi:hypothetical protein